MAELAAYWTRSSEDEVLREASMAFRRADLATDQFEQSAFTIIAEYLDVDPWADAGDWPASVRQRHTNLLRRARALSHYREGAA